MVTKRVTSLIICLFIMIFLGHPIFLMPKVKTKDTFLSSLQLSASLPFKYTLNNGRSDESDYGDKIFERYAMPFTIGSSVDTFTASIPTFALHHLEHRLQ